jgi:hypothetical protein
LTKIFDPSLFVYNWHLSSLSTSYRVRERERERDDEEEASAIDQGERVDFADKPADI